MRRTNFDPAPDPEVAKVWLSWMKWRSIFNRSSPWEYSEMIRDTIWGDLPSTDIKLFPTLVIMDIVPDSSGQGLWIIREREHLYIAWNSDYHKFVHLTDPIPIREALVVASSRINRQGMDKYLLNQKNIT